MRLGLLSLLFLLWNSTAVAQSAKRPESYNYLRGVEAVQNEKVDEAIEYFNKDIQENPKNGYSFTWLALIRLTQEEYGMALTAANMALKTLPKKDDEYLVFAYSTRAKIYLALEDTTKAVNDCTAAIKAQPDEEDMYTLRAQIYYEQGEYALSDADYHKMIALDAGGVMGYMGIGRNANAQEKWEDAIQQFNYVEKLTSQYSSVYSFRAESYIGLKKYAEATDDIIKALAIDGDDKAFFLMQTLDEEAYPAMKAKLKIQCTKNPNEAQWPYYLGLLEEKQHKYKSAITSYLQANDLDASPDILKRIALCYSEMGDYERGLRYIEQGLSLDSTRLDLALMKAETLYEFGKRDEAIAELGKVIRQYPEAHEIYQRRGWFYEYSGMLDEALEDYEMAATLEPNNAYYAFCRGHVYQKQGKEDLARAEFNKVIELETDSTQYSCIHFAYLGIGNKEKAKEYMDIIMRNSDENEYYNAACLYSLMGEKDAALGYLRKALENGYVSFAHMGVDTDLDNIRQTEEYKKLVKEFKEKFESEQSDDTPVSVNILDLPDDTPIGVSFSRSESATAEIPFTKEDGVCKVKCQINGLPLHFVFDMGASDVTLSMVEATFMMKNGYLTEGDVIGSQRYMDANGNVNVGTVVNLKNVNFGGQELKNVRASVVRNQKAPLLLGQSVLGRLEKIEIDNENMLIRING